MGAPLALPLAICYNHTTTHTIADIHRTHRTFAHPPVGARRAAPVQNFGLITCFIWSVVDPVGSTLKRVKYQNVIPLRTVHRGPAIVHL